MAADPDKLTRQIARRRLAKAVFDYMEDSKLPRKQRRELARKAAKELYRSTK